MYKRQIAKKKKKKKNTHTHTQKTKKKKNKQTKNELSWNCQQRNVYVEKIINDSEINIPNRILETKVGKCRYSQRRKIQTDTCVWFAEYYETVDGYSVNYTIISTIIKPWKDK